MFVPINYHTRLIINTPPFGKWAVFRRFITLVIEKLAVTAEEQPSAVLGIEIFGVELLDGFIDVCFGEILF